MKPYSVFRMALQGVAMFVLATSLAVAGPAPAKGEDGTSASSSNGKSAAGFKQPCAGPSGLSCPGGMMCVDDPADDCDPTQDGISCMGKCVAAPDKPAGGTGTGSGGY